MSQTKILKPQDSWDEQQTQKSSEDSEFSQNGHDHQSQHSNDHSHQDEMERPLSRHGAGDDRKMKICRVCGDRALSVNFNVVTCESCKAFFRRNALKPKAFRCPFSGVCEINVVSRKFCKKCRLRKCFEVGMMKEWIMSDEARLKKRELINMNREKRRTVIMATAAKHGLDAIEVDKLDSDDVTCLDNPKPHHGNFSADEGYFSSERSSDEMVSTDFVPIATRDPLITVHKSALVEFAVQCRCPYKDLTMIIDDFIERNTTNGTKTGFRRGSIIRQADSSQHSPFHISKSAMCDCSMCTDYRLKVPSLSSTQLTAQVHLPTLNADGMTKLDEASTAGNMLSFLAPSFGKYYHAVEYPSMVGGQNTLPSNRPPAGAGINQITPSPWTQSVTSMPTIPLEGIQPPIYDMVNIHRQNTLSCSLPIKLVNPHNDTPRLIGEELAKKAVSEIQMAENLKNHAKLMSGLSAGQFGPITTGTQATSVLRYAAAGKLSKLPYAMLPRLQELVDAKKFLIEEFSGDPKGERGLSCDDPEEYFKHIMAYNRLIECDRITLLNANRSETTVLCQVMFYDIFGPPSQVNAFKFKKELEICEKYVKVIPKVWRNDDCIMLTLMAISMFNTNGCHLLCKAAIDEQRNFYIEMLRKYLECIYKQGEVQAAQNALLDIIYDMRYEKAESSIPARSEQMVQA